MHDVCGAFIPLCVCFFFFFSELDFCMKKVASMKTDSSA